MSLYDDASLIMYPSGYKEDKIYSLKPTDGSGDLTFTRASSATRVNAEGLIEEVPYNLLTYSNDFSQWGSSARVLRNSGQIGYDGSNDAWLIAPTTTSNTHLVGQVVAGSGTKTISVYAKGGGYNYFSMRDNTSYAKFDLDLGVSATNGAGAISSTINSVGDGWYKCTFTYTKSVDGNVLFYINNTYGNADVFAGDGTSGVYFQDAQLNSGSTAKTYFPTTDRLNVPRIDYTGGGCGKLLLEPQRTNLLTYSSEFSQWSQVGLTNTDNETTSPDGSLNASLITEDANLSNKYTFLNLSTTTNEHTLSFFAKDNGRYLQVAFGSNDVSGNPYINFDLQNGTYNNNGVSNPLIQDFGDGWYKISMQVTPIVTSNFGVLFSPKPSFTSSRLISYQGDGTSGVYIWGAQLEQGSYATSYIPTAGAAATRVADSASKTGISSLIGQTEGVLYAEISALANDGTNRFVSISDGSTNNRVTLKFDNIDNRLEFFVFSGGSASYSFITVIPNTTINNKIAIKYKANDFSVYINGTEMDASASGIVPTGLSELSFDQGDGANPFYGNVQNLMVFPSALTDDELETLTTL